MSDRDPFTCTTTLPPFASCSHSLPFSKLLPYSQRRAPGLGKEKRVNIKIVAKKKLRYKVEELDPGDYFVFEDNLYRKLQLFDTWTVIRVASGYEQTFGTKVIVEKATVRIEATI